VVLFTDETAAGWRDSKKCYWLSKKNVFCNNSHETVLKNV